MNCVAANLRPEPKETPGIMSTTTQVRPSDQTITCPCCGAERSIRVQSWRYLRRLASPAFEAELHRLATGGAR